MPPDGSGYLSYLRHLVRHYNLEDFVMFEINVRFDRLLDHMCKSKVYLHPLPGEPFGISTVEAMSAGIIPVVPDVGGHTEFVPAKYQFHTFKQGVQAIEAGALCSNLRTHSDKSFDTKIFCCKLYQEFATSPSRSSGYQQETSAIKPSHFKFKEADRVCGSPN